MRKPNWDTSLGYAMYLEGKKDTEIAEALGVSVHAVAQQRLKNWRIGPGIPQREQEEEEIPAGQQEPAAPSAAVDPAPEGDLLEDQKTNYSPPPERVIDLMDVREMATGHLTGMRAVCTAGAIQHLLGWRYPEDLLRARDHIDYLLDQLKKMEGR